MTGSSQSQPELGSGPTAQADGVHGALVVGGAHNSLAVVRSLGRRGIPVWYLTHDHPLARYSRYTNWCGRWPGPNSPAAGEWLLDFGRKHQLDGWVLFVCGDAEVQVAARNHDALSSVFRMTTPPWAITRWTADKRLTYQYANDVGVHTPWSCYPQSLDEVAQVECRFPVILKPTVHEQRNAFTQAKAWRVDDREALLHDYADAAALVGERSIVLQELIPGSGEQQFSFTALCERGEPVATLVARRVRQFPIDFGFTSTLVETVEQPAVEDAACRVLRALEYTGLVEVEFKYDERDGRYKLLDINARPWTWIGLGTAVGVDFPFLAWRLAHGETPEPVRAAPGVRWMHATRDFSAACQEIWMGKSTPARYVRSLRRPLTFAVFAKDDPVPGFIELPLVIARALTRSPDPAPEVSGKPPAVEPRTTG